MDKLNQNIENGNKEKIKSSFGIGKGNFEILESKSSRVNATKKSKNKNR